MRTSFVLRLVALTASFLICSTLEAATATATFGVSAAVQATCLISTTPLAFGSYSGVLIDTQSTITVTCTNTTTYNVGLNAGGGGSVSNRQMSAGGADKLNYSISRDSGRTSNWGSTLGTDTVSGTGNGLTQTLNVYGRLPSGQFVTPGEYSDTITATITY